MIDAVERHRESDPRVIRGESLDQGHAVHGLGRRDRVYQRSAGAVFEAEMVVTEHEPPERITWAVSAWKAGEYVADISTWFSARLEAMEGGTLVAFVVAYTPEARWQRVVSRFGRRWEERQVAEALDGLAERCRDRAP